MSFCFCERSERLCHKYSFNEGKTSISNLSIFKELYVRRKVKLMKKLVKKKYVQWNKNKLMLERKGIVIKTKQKNGCWKENKETNWIRRKSKWIRFYRGNKRLERKEWCDWEKYKLRKMGKILVKMSDLENFKGTRKKKRLRRNI